VLSEDTVRREVLNGCLHSMRLLTKTNLPPKWGEHVVSARTVKILEESIVDPQQRTLTTYTRNLGFTRVMVSTLSSYNYLKYKQLLFDIFSYQSIVEKVVYREHKDNPSQTVAERFAWIDSQVYGLSHPIQAFGLERFKNNCKKAEKGFQHILSILFPGHDHLPNIIGPHVPFVEQQREKLLESAKRATELARAKTRPMVAACQPEV
jgi:hypothetical protein